MLQVLSRLSNICQVYIDDIVTFGKDMPKFLANVETVLNRLKERHMVLRPDKCRIGLRKVEYLGFVVDDDGMLMSPDHTRALAEVKPPSTRSELKSFYGLANCFRAYIPNFAILMQPLTVLCLPKIAYHWMDEAQAAFEEIHKAACSTTMLYHVNYDQPLILRTDASLHGIGAILFNVENDQEHPVWYLSQAFSGAVHNWSTIEQEAYAVFWSILVLEHILRGHAFHVQTDHHNLVYVYKSQVPKLL